MKVPRPSIFLQFVTLGTIVFIVLGIFLSSLIEPAINKFILEQRELNSVVFANRLAAEILRAEDFKEPAKDVETITRFEQFTKLLQVPGLFRIKIYNPSGVIIYSDEKRLIGQKFPLSEALEEALDLKTTAEITEFDINDPHDQYEVPFIRGLEVYVPITYGNSIEVVGVVETYSRTGFLEKQVDELKDFFTRRVIYSLLIMFAVLSLIVWRASRTVGQQRKKILVYAAGLEKMVKTRTRQLEKATQREINKAKELLKLKDQFVFIAAHELSTPASAIKWVLGAMKSKHSKIVSEEKEYFDILQKSNQRLLNLVKDILNIARIESKVIDIKLKNVSPLEAISEAQDELRDRLTKFDVVIENKVPKNIPDVMADEMRLREVFVNLISNAIKYSKGGKIVTISAELKNNLVIFHIADKGIGMTFDQQKHVFEKFWRSKDAMYTEGTGLGLFIVKELINLMSGKIWFKTKLKEGTTFSFSLKKAGAVSKKLNNKKNKKKNV